MGGIYRSPVDSPHKGQCDAELWCFLWSAPEQTVEKTIDTPHDDVIKWKHFPRNWPFVRGIHRSPVNSLHTKASDAELWCFLWSVPEQTVEKNNNRDPGDLRRHRAQYDVTVIMWRKQTHISKSLRLTPDGAREESNIVLMTDSTRRLFIQRRDIIFLRHVASSLAHYFYLWVGAKKGRNFRAIALMLRLFCTDPSKCW